MAKSKAAKKRKKRELARLRAGQINGHGDYSYNNPGPWGKAGRELGAKGGGALGAAAGEMLMPGPGALVGAQLGETLGKYLGGAAHWIGRLFGSGDYHMEYGPEFYKTNSLFARGPIPGPRPGGPSFMQQQPTRVTHRFYIGPVLSSVEDRIVDVVPVAMGNEDFGPWLASLAQHYQAAEIHGVVFEYVSTASFVGSTSSPSLGHVSMGVQRDPYRAPPSTRQDLLGLDGAQSAAPVTSQLIGVECDRKFASYNRVSVWPPDGVTTGDLRLYELGKLYVMTGGQQINDAVLGDFFATVDVSLFSPCLPQVNAAVEPGYAFFQLQPRLSSPFLMADGSTVIDRNYSNITFNADVPNAHDYVRVPRPSAGGDPTVWLWVGYVESNTTSFATTPGSVVVIPDESGVQLLNKFSGGMPISTTGTIHPGTFAGQERFCAAAVFEVAHNGTDVTGGIEIDPMYTSWGGGTAGGTGIVVQIAETAAAAIAAAAANGKEELWQHVSKFCKVPPAVKAA